MKFKFSEETDYTSKQKEEIINFFKEKTGEYYAYLESINNATIIINSKKIEDPFDNFQFTAWGTFPVTDVTTKLISLLEDNDNL